MADQNSARPTGDRAPYARSGLTLKTLQDMGFGASRITFAGLVVIVALTHVLVAMFTAGDTNNTIWPTLLIGYSLIFATTVFRTQGPTISPQFAFFHGHERYAQTLRDERDRQPASDHLAFQDRDGTDHVDLAHVYQIRNQTLNRRSTDIYMTASPKSSNSDWTDLLSQVSHELRTPLNAMIGFSDVMNAEVLGPLDNPRYREYLAHIRESGHELLKSTEDTLAMTSLLANRGAYDHRSGHVQLREAILEAWEFVAQCAARRSISVRVQQIADVPVAADIRPLRQSFVNLFSEAIKVAERHGEVVVSTRLVGDVVEVEIRTQMSQPPQSTLPPSLSTAIAKALLELQGTSLATVVDEAGVWVAATQFECRMQSDFFDFSDKDRHTDTGASV